MNPGNPRERALEALLRGRSRPGPATAQCLDAETMAAYADGGLSGPTLADAEAHLAGCAHCQTVMAAIVTSAGDVGQAPAQVPKRPWWGLDLRWLMPLAGAAAAAVLWMVVPTSGPAPQEARLQDAAAPAAMEPSTESPPPAREPGPSVSPRAGGSPATGPAPPQEAGKKLAREAVPELAARQPDQNLRERAETDEARRNSAKPGHADADLLAKAEDRAAPVAGVAPAAPPAAQESQVAVAPAAPQAQAAAPAPATQAFRSVDSSALTGTPTDLRSLDPNVRWRLAEPGFVERSTNGGASWDRFDTGVRTPLRAGACPSASTCWVVGDGGVVLRTSDARTWRPVTSPSPENLVAVETAGEAAAVVRAASGERFRTSDRGMTWTREP